MPQIFIGGGCQEEGGGVKRIAIEVNKNEQGQEGAKIAEIPFRYHKKIIIKNFYSQISL